MPDAAAVSGGLAATIRVGDHAYSLCLPHHQVDVTQLKLSGTGRPFEEALLEAMAQLLAPDDLVVDVGACVGNHTFYLAAIAGCQVTAYEPNPALAAGLRRSVELNDLGDKVTVREAAVASARGRGLLGDLDPRDLAAQSVTVMDQDHDEGDVEVVALDDEEFPGRVAALKIDVAGGELEVLRGARDLIHRDRPLIVVQCSDLRRFREIRAFADELGYVMVGSHHVPPAVLFRAAVGSPEESRVVASLVTATEQLYDLRSAKGALRDELGEQARTHVGVVRDLEESLERASGRAERLEVRLFRARTDAAQARLDTRVARRALDEVDEARRSLAVRLARASEQLAVTRRSLSRVRAQREKLRNRRMIKVADRLGSVRRRFTSP